MQQIKNVLYKTVFTNIIGSNMLLLAFSGGLDSTVLLDILSIIRDSLNKENIVLNLRAVYINHGLNKNANQWSVHCKQQCLQRNITFNVVKVKIDNIHDGIQLAARKARYQALEKILLEGETLLTAQHQDDQVETLILALKRGSGPKGLSAMPEETIFCGHRFLRPLLTFNKNQLKIYADERQLSWIEDKSNNDLSFDRIFLRLKILPLLNERWPWFFKTVARSAHLCAEQEKLLNELLIKKMSSIVHSDGSLEFRSLIVMSKVLRYAILRRWLFGYGVKMPSYQKLSVLWREVVLSRCDAIVKFKIDNKILCRFHNNLYLLPLEINYSYKKIVLFWSQHDKEILLPNNLGKINYYLISPDMLIKQKEYQKLIYTTNLVNITLSEINKQLLHFDTVLFNFFLNLKKTILIFTNIIRAPLKKELVSIRFNIVGYGLIYIVGRNRGRVLKKLWQEFKIPYWQRGKIPLLFYDEKFIAALGVFVTMEGRVQNNCTQWLIIWQQKQPNNINNNYYR